MKETSMGDVSGVGSAVAAAHMQGARGGTPTSEAKKAADVEFQQKLDARAAEEVAKEAATAPPKPTDGIDVMV